MMKKVEIIKFLLVLIILCSSVAAESPVNQPPEAYFTASPSSGQSPLTVQFDASGSEDMDGTIVSYDWFFGDVNKKYDGNIVSYTYKNFGTFDASLKVTGKDGTPIPGALVTLSYTRGNFDVKAGNSIIFMILAFLLIIIIVTAFQEFWVKGRLQLIPLKTEVPCDGKSPIPIKVQFVDPSGKPKIQKKNCMVELKSSSGTIQNAVILAGKESVEAILTSSHVCGLVNVNARSGFHKATTKVNFAGHVAGIVLEVAPVKIPADGLSISSAVVKVMDDKGNFITSLDDWVIEMTTSLGTITSPVKVTPGTLSGIAILTSCKRTGTATVTATMGKFRAEKKVIFEELAERYCMHCGDPLKREINTCPNCKKTPPPNTEIKECNSCQTVIPAQASFCDRCGAKQPV